MIRLTNFKESSLRITETGTWSVSYDGKWNCKSRFSRGFYSLYLFGGVQISGYGSHFYSFKLN